MIFKIKYRSHPSFPLEVHLEQVAKTMAIRVQELIFDQFPIIKGYLEQFSYLIGIFHDFGKFTDFFQDKLDGKPQTEEERALSHHSALSAIIGSEFINLFYLKPLLESAQLDDLFHSILYMISYICIRRHHSNLVSLDYEFDIRNQKILEEMLLCPKQLNNILKPKNKAKVFLTLGGLIKKKIKNCSQEEISSLLDVACDKFRKINEIETHLNDLKQKLSDVKKKNFLGQKKDLKLDSLDYLHFFALNQLFFSLLIDSDKLMAAKIQPDLFNRRSIPDDIIETYKSQVFTPSKPGTLNSLREDFYESVVKRLESPQIKNKNIFSITAPTGIGKTLTVLAYSLKLRRKIEESAGVTPRIIYCLPFTSIIDQNYDVIQEILKTNLSDFEENQENYLIKHHHLTSYRYKHDSKEIPNEQALLLIESWNSEIISTTFYQVFHTLFGYRNQDLKKFHKLLNSIIIFDEIQAFPPEYWFILRCMTLYLAKYFKTKFIFLTATQPAFFKSDEIIEILDDPNLFFKNHLLDRISLTSNLKSSSIEDALKVYRDNQSDYKSFIIILNTIKSSLDALEFIVQNFKNVKSVQIFEELDEAYIKDNGINDIKYVLNEKLLEKGDYILFYLSTNLFPRMRRERIKFIKQIQNTMDYNSIVVTTQLVEAGVDIDAKCLIRDFSPLDSLIQAAGRCNRNNKKKEGEEKKGRVNIHNLVDKRNNPYSEYIYDDELLNFTKEILKDKKEGQTSNKIWNESAFHDLTRTYFNRLNEKFAYSNRYIDIISQLEYNSRKNESSMRTKSISDFKLIKKEYETREIYINYTHQSNILLKRFFRLLNELRYEYGKETYFTKRIELKSLRKKMMDYTISIPQKYVDHYVEQGLIENNNLDFLIISKKNISLIYDSLTGFRRIN